MYAKWFGKLSVAELCQEARATVGFHLVLQQGKAGFSTHLTWAGKAVFTPGRFLLVSRRRAGRSWKADHRPL